MCCSMQRSETKDGFQKRLVKEMAVKAKPPHRLPEREWEADQAAVSTACDALASSSSCSENKRSVEALIEAL